MSSHYLSRRDSLGLHGYVDRLLKVLVADGYVEETGAGLYRANGVTKVMADYNFQGLISEQFEIGLATSLALPDWLKKESYKEPTKASKTVFAQVQNTDKTTFQWFADPNNARALSSAFNLVANSSSGRRKR